MEKENREHKDSVFVDLFYQDETAKKNLLSLYNALHDTEYEDENLVRKVKIDDVLYKNFKNDISFEVNGQVLVFGEHQSTVNMNMCLRCLMYVGRAYEQLVDRKARYRTTLVKIPTPEFYTFYNGKKEQPLERVLSLSDAFMNPAGENSVELKVKVININSDKAHELLGKCGILKEYSQFISMVRKYSDEESAIKKAIRECMEQGILSDYLKRKGSEVENMLIAEYSYEEDIQVKQEEAMQQGVQKGIRQGRQEGLILCGKIFQAVKKNPDFTNEQIALKLACSVEEVESTKKMFGI
ncbi:Rpn family recombination-promoting nuclease/putative transposase [Sporofaciens musculi]|jgi:predicted transposase YdaD|uniref:Rpn family recombination-promoting nuclease/putative transposase n=1 Tax=Sporofaciens musculi TaxID=2681861 RepID=UPI00258FA975|nr:Rpn family recombination-promoting nuclease/putative transposase [Sporofaciens musculi]